MEDEDGMAWTTRTRTTNGRRPSSRHRQELLTGQGPGVTPAPFGDMDFFFVTSGYQGEPMSRNPHSAPTVGVLR